MSTPRISIGVPVFNGERYLAKTLDSLLAQTFPDFELLISDNASTDSTEAIGRAYARRDKRVRYFRNATNLGVAENYRCLLHRSSGEYFRWANSDDLFAPESLARCVEVLERDPSVVLTYPRARLIDASGDIIGDYDDSGLHLVSDRASQRFVQVCLKIRLVHVYFGLVRASALRKTRLVRRFPGGDIPLVAELALYGKFWEIPEVLFSRRFHAHDSRGSTEAQRQKLFDPQRRGRPSLQAWSTLRAHLDSVRRAPVSPREKLALTLFLTKTVIWSRAKLAQEASIALRQLTGRAWLSRRHASSRRPPPGVQHEGWR